MPEEGYEIFPLYECTGFFFAGVSYQAKRAVYYRGKSSQVKPVAFLDLWVFQEDLERGHWKMTP